MKKLFAKFRSMTYEERLPWLAMITTGVSFLISVVKLLVGVFSDPTVIAVGIFGLVLVSVKIQCILGIKTDKHTFAYRNAAVAGRIFTAGVVYIVYMAVQLRYGLFAGEYDRRGAIAMATVAFCEMGVAVYGLVKTKRLGHLYRDIKIISTVSAMSAMLTAQIAIMSFTDAMHGNAARANCISGINIGVITILLAVLVYFAPKISTVDRHHNVFALTDAARNGIIDMSAVSVGLAVRKSRIYGDWVYKAQIQESRIDGSLVKTDGLLRRLNVAWKIVFIILSEILIFVWLFGYVVHFIRTVDMPKKLDKLMTANGFLLIAVDDGSSVGAETAQFSAEA